MTDQSPSDLPLVFVDVETTGLDPTRHGVWEVALVGGLDGAVLAHFGIDARETRKLTTATPLEAFAAAAMGRELDRTPWRPQVDQEALAVGRYADRIDDLVQPGEEGVARIVDQWTDGVHLVGANPAFDAAFLTAMLARHGLTPGWHHRLIDVEAVALGWAHGIRDTHLEGRPRSLSTIAATLGLDVDARARHTAVGDAQLARDVWLHLAGGRR